MPIARRCRTRAPDPQRRPHSRAPDRPERKPLDGRARPPPRHHPGPRPVCVRSASGGTSSVPDPGWLEVPGPLLGPDIAPSRQADRSRGLTPACNRPRRTGSRSGVRQGVPSALGTGGETRRARSRAATSGNSSELPQGTPGCTSYLAVDTVCPRSRLTRYRVPVPPVRGSTVIPRQRRGWGRSRRPPA